MSQNYVQIYDDTVIKLSIAQGLEIQRTATTLGSFTVGELIYTRDTSRVFVGDCNNKDNPNGEYAETIGGTLVGNKYLGFVDSKPLAYFDNNDVPLSYENQTQYNVSSDENFYSEWKENGLFLDSSKYKLQYPKSFDWDRTSTFNENYKAYNGDYVYDVFRNAIIFFDKNIQIENEETSPRKTYSYNNKIYEYYTINDKNYCTDPTIIIPNLENVNDLPEDEYKEERRVALLSIKRKTPFMNYKTDDEDSGGYNEIYGNGYAIFRLIEPDNATIRFKKKTINGSKSDGNIGDSIDNYNHNLLEVFNVTGDAAMGAMDENSFVLNEGNNKIELNFDSALVSKNDNASPNKDKFLALNDKIYIANYDKNITISDKITERKFSNIDYIFKIRKYEDDEKSFQLWISPDDELKTVNYLKLGDGLTSLKNKNEVSLVDETDGIKLDLTEISSDGSDVSPFYTETKSTLTYTSNLGTYNGTIYLIDKWDDSLSSNDKKYIEKFVSENTNNNLLKKPIFVYWTNSNYDSTKTENNSNVLLEYYTKPYFYCNRKVITLPNSRLLEPVGSLYVNSTIDSTYFDNFTNEQVSLWDNLYQTIGNNSYLNYTNSSGENEEFYITETEDFNNYKVNENLSKKTFKSCELLTFNDNSLTLNVPTMSNVGDIYYSDLNSLLRLDVYVDKTTGIVEIYDSSEDDSQITKITLNYISESGNQEMDIKAIIESTLTLENIAANNFSNLEDVGFITKVETDEETDEYYVLSIEINKTSKLFFDEKIQLPKSIILNNYEVDLLNQYKLNSKLNDLVFVQSTTDEIYDDVVRNVYISSEIINDVISFEKIEISQDNASLYFSKNESGVYSIPTPSLSGYTNAKYIIFETYTLYPEEAGESVSDNTTMHLYTITDYGLLNIDSNSYHIPEEHTGKIVTWNGQEYNQVNGAKLKENLELDDEQFVTIPKNSRGLILEFTNITNDNNCVSVFMSNSMQKLKFIDNDVIPSEESYNLNKLNITIPVVTHTLENGVYKSSLPSLKTNAEDLYGANEEEIMIYSSKETETKTLIIPLIYDDFIKCGKLCLRVVNSKGGNNNCFYIRLIGYTL